MFSWKVSMPDVKWAYAIMLSTFFILLLREYFPWALFFLLLLFAKAQLTYEFIKCIFELYSPQFYFSSKLKLDRCYKRSLAGLLMKFCPVLSPIALPYDFLSRFLLVSNSQLFSRSATSLTTHTNSLDTDISSCPDCAWFIVLYCYVVRW